MTNHGETKGKTLHDIRKLGEEFDEMIADRNGEVGDLETMEHIRGEIKKLRQLLQQTHSR
jgi:NifU-like protein involved in Fe-S cluster formation